MSENTVDRKDLKIKALRESTSKLVSDYEDRIAELRIELTIHATEIDNLRAHVQNLENENNSLRAELDSEKGDPDVSEEADTDPSE